MKIQPINSNYYNQNNNVKKTNKVLNMQTKINQPTFCGRLDVWDKLAGAVCGTVVAVVTTAVAGPVAGITAGIVGGKAVAEANHDSRN